MYNRKGKSNRAWDWDILLCYKTSVWITILKNDLYLKHRHLYASAGAWIRARPSSNIWIKILETTSNVIPWIDCTLFLIDQLIHRFTCLDLFRTDQLIHRFTCLDLPFFHIDQLIHRFTSLDLPLFHTDQAVSVLVVRQTVGFSRAPTAIHPLVQLSQR